MQVSDFESTVESEIELYDTDRQLLSGVITQLSRAVGSRRNLEGFRQEVADRFYAAGFLVDVRVFEGEVEGMAERLFLFKAVLCGRVEPEPEYDHDRQAHEVRRNVLDKPGMSPVSIPVAVTPPRLGRTKSGLLLPPGT